MNAGKQFEQDVAKSLPEGIYSERLKDPAQSFTPSDSLRFSPNQPYDYFWYSHPNLFTLELKTTDGALTFWREDFGQDGKRHTFNIKKHQINGLFKAAQFQGVISGLILNFRKINQTYFVRIQDFLEYTDSLPKKSINEKDIQSISHIIIEQKKLKVHYRYDIAKFIKDCRKRYFSQT